MHKFEIYGMKINSDIEFEQLLPGGTGDRDDQNEIIVKKENIKDEVNLLLKDTDRVYKITYDVSCFKNSRGYFFFGS